MGGRIRVLAVAVAALTALTLMQPVGAQDERPEPVLTSRAGEFQVVTGSGYLAWTKTTKRVSSQLMVRTPSGKTFRANRRGTKAALGAIVDKTLVYQEFTRRRSRIRFMNLRTRRRWDAPRAVNRRGTWPFFPVMSARWLAFARYTRAGDSELVAYDRRNKRSRLLFDSETEGTQTLYLQPGQLSGSYFVSVLWNRGYHRSGLLVYNLRNGDYYALYGDQHEYLWAPSIRSDGTLYTVATGRYCGTRSRLLRYPLYDRDQWLRYEGRQTLLDLPDGVDSSHTHTYIGRSGTARVLFHKLRCSNPVMSGNVYRISDMQMVTVSREGLGFGAVYSRPPGIGCGEDCEERFPGGSRVTLVAQPAPGSQFEGWSGDCIEDPDSECQLTMDGPKEVMAHFGIGP